MTENYFTTNRITLITLSGIWEGDFGLLVKHLLNRKIFLHKIFYGLKASNPYPGNMVSIFISYHIHNLFTQYKFRIAEK